MKVMNAPHYDTGTDISTLTSKQTTDMRCVFPELTIKRATPETPGRHNLKLWCGHGMQRTEDYPTSSNFNLRLGVVFSRLIRL